MTAAKKKAFVARMAKARKAAARNPSTNPSSRKKSKSKSRKKNNPATSNRPKHRRKRNPDGLRAIIGSPRQLATQAVVGLLAAVATRQLPQMVLGADNKDWKGYFGNGLTAAAAAWAAAVFLGPSAGQAALIGGSVILLDRILTEKVSPVGKYLSLTGLGDATAATGLGTIADGYFVYPTVRDAQGNPVIPHEITDAGLSAMRQLLPAPPSSGSMQGVMTSGRFKSRF